MIMEGIVKKKKKTVLYTHLALMQYVIEVLLVY